MLHIYRKKCYFLDAQKFQRIFKIWVLIMFLIEQMPQSVATKNIDMITEYNLEASSSSSSSSNSSKSALHNRFPKSKLNLLPSTLAPAKSISSTATTDAANNNEVNVADEPHHLLVSMSSKSYITAPTTAASKLMKRAGNLAELKPRNAGKLLKDNLRQNRTRDVEGRNRPHGDVGDHIPDSSGHVPYRIGRPVLAPPPPPNADYGSIVDGPIINVNEGSDDDSTASDTYHSVPYESEKWQNNEYWDQDYDKNLVHNTTRVQHIEAECQDDYMKIRIGFNGSFNGLLYSAGYAYDPDCMYINGSGRDYYEFFIQLNRCGTLGKNALHDESRKNPTNFMWNTVTVQYNPMIEEEYDEHFKVTCEYGYDFWKTVTFPFLDVEVATGNPVVFTLSPPECYMEIQNGYGIGGPRVTGPVRVGDPLTLIIFMRSKYDGFDIVVNDCYAHNGANKRIQLIDEYGCPVDDKLISRFRGSWSDSGVFETQVYAYMKTFRFTGSPALYIECDVRMCHGRCPSQPCHWRNLKAVTKRDISNSTTSAAAATTTAATKSETALSENVNLFQSLHVLQEGESDDVDDVYSPHQRHTGTNAAQQTCLKTSTLTALLATAGVLMSIMCATLIVACSRLKQRSKEAMHYSNYITHKGQID